MSRYQRILLTALSQQGINPRQGYSPRGGCSQAIAGTGPEILISGPAGTGKSRAVLEKLHFIARHYPGSRCLIVRKTRESLTESALLTYEDHVLGPNHPLTYGPQRASRKSYSYPNGSEIVVGGLKSYGRDQTAKIMSTEYDLIYVQEAIELTEAEWEDLTTRLRNGKVDFQQIIADTNPSYPTHWLKQRADRGDTLLIESRHTDNPKLWDLQAGHWTRVGADYIAKLDSLTGHRKERLRYGRWVQAEGVVYPEWDRAVHLVDSLPPEILKDLGWVEAEEKAKALRKYRSIDFGYTNPFSCLWGALDGDGRLYIYRQIYHTQRTVRRHSQDIKKHSQGERYRASVADHDAEDRATLAENGIRTKAARKAVSVGLERVRERLKIAGDGRPRLYILKDSLIERDESLVEAGQPWELGQEFDSYIWADKKGDQPVKESDHGQDALRYMIMEIDGGPKGPIAYEI